MAFRCLVIRCDRSKHRPVRKTRGQELSLRSPSDAILNPTRSCEINVQSTSPRNRSTASIITSARYSPSSIQPPTCIPLPKQSSTQPTPPKKNPDSLHNTHTYQLTTIHHYFSAARTHISIALIHSRKSRNESLRAGKFLFCLLS